MAAAKMHADEVATDAGLVRRLLAGQFPQWADLPIEPVPSAGTDNALYRLGNELVVRMPRISWATGQIDKERRWLPHLAPRLPLAIPAPVAVGEPAEGFPWRWSVYRWLDGENATLDRLADPDGAARDLAHFVRALQAIDATGGPLREPGTFGRGVPLAVRDAGTREAIAACDGLIDTHAATLAWEAALAAPAWRGPPVWLHGDLQSGNLLAVKRRLSAVIDFGALTIGDPACDLMVAWNLFTAGPRAVFRAAIAVDDATWARGRGWALSPALVALPYYRESNPGLAAIARHAIAEVLADRESG
jgi:aminoglycoside phosphotransferase (APT) family kinase protein